jgi:CubicO group peptidase (beta-lactamase class C family)
MDMAKIGQLYLNCGKWNGKQIVSTEWVNESLKEHSYSNDFDLPYGYLWIPKIGNGYAAMGDSGNVIYVSTKKELVVAIASLFKPTAKDRINFITDPIEPIFEN